MTGWRSAAGASDPRQHDARQDRCLSAKRSRQRATTLQLACPSASTCSYAASARPRFGLMPCHGNGQREGLKRIHSMDTDTWELHERSATSTTRPFQYESHEPCRRLPFHFDGRRRLQADVRQPQADSNSRNSAVPQAVAVASLTSRSPRSLTNARSRTWAYTAAGRSRSR